LIYAEFGVSMLQAVKQSGLAFWATLYIGGKILSLLRFAGRGCTKRLSNSDAAVFDSDRL